MSTDHLAILAVLGTLVLVATIYVHERIEAKRAESVRRQARARIIEANRAACQEPRLFTASQQFKAELEALKHWADVS